MRVVSGGEVGRRIVQPSPCNESEIPCDLAIVAAGQGPDLSALPEDVQLSGGRVWVDTFGRMGSGKTYAGGDLTPARASVVDAMASGKRAAVAIHFDLQEHAVADRVKAVTLGEGPSFSIQAMFEPPLAWAPNSIVHLHEMTLVSAHPQAPLVQTARPPEERIRDFENVVAGFDRESAIREADRCFYCGVCVGCDRCFIYCPDASVSRPGEIRGRIPGPDRILQGLRHLHRGMRAGRHADGGGWMKAFITGNHAVAEAVRLCRPRSWPRIP